MMQTNLTIVENAVTEACRKSGRPRSAVKILLASKKVSVDKLQEVIRKGYTLLGENTAQELTSKHPLLPAHAEWHFIGHLQTNKVKDVVPICSLIHSVDRLSLAQEISKRSGILGKVQSILLEVNTSGEAAKSGISPEELISLCREISLLPHLLVKGLMTVPLNTDDEKEVRACFQTLKNCFTKVKSLNLAHFQMQELSMGMSQDYPLAIEEGATLIRLGTAVFGPRTQN